MEQRNIKIGTHGEQYGNWMFGGLLFTMKYAKKDYDGR